MPFRTWFPGVLLLSIILVLSACGIVGLYEARAMTADQLAMQSDEYVCEAASRMAGAERYVPPIWIRELKKRGLDACLARWYAK